MPQYLLKASDSEFDQWRAEALRVLGERKLAAWMRMTLNAAAGPSANGVRLGGHVVSPDVVLPERARVAAYAHPADVPAVEELLARVPERAFRPDPRPTPKKKTR